MGRENNQGKGFNKGGKGFNRHTNKGKGDQPNQGKGNGSPNKKKGESNNTQYQFMPHDPLIPQAHTYQVVWDKIKPKLQLAFTQGNELVECIETDTKPDWSKSAPKAVLFLRRQG